MDEKVASAISHWAPRFTTNGITVADFERVTSGLERWSDWCAAWSAAAAEHEQLGRTALAEGRTRSAGEHLSMAAVYFHFAKFVFVEDYEQMRSGAPERGALPGRRAAPSGPARAPGRGRRSRAPRWSASCGCPPATARTPRS